jgi:hypothetical protein
MNAARVFAWEDRLTRFAVLLLLLAAAYGIVVGALIAMYCDSVPNMGALEDSLAAGPVIA